MAASSAKKANEIALTADADIAAEVARLKTLLMKGITPVINLPANASLADQLLAQVLQKLTQIQVDTEASDTGSLPGAGWYVDEYTNNLPDQATNQIQIGQTVTVVNKPSELGKLYSAILMTNNQYLTFTVQVYAPDGTVQTVTASPWLFQQVGNTQANTRVPYLTRYDTTNNVYGIQWTPNPSIPYVGVKASLANPPVIPVLQATGIVNSATPNTVANVMFLGVIRRVYTGL